MFFRDEDRHQLEQFFAERLEKDVELIAFSQDEQTPDDPLPCQCELCDDLEEMTTELASLSPLLSARVFHVTQSEVPYRQYGVEKVPAIALASDGDYPLRFYGIPSNYEFGTFLESIYSVSTGETELSPDILAEVQAIRQPIHLQVFYTQTCALCPIVTHLAAQFAVVNPLIHADIIDAMQFPQLAKSFGVRGVPHTVINGNLSTTGVKTEPELLRLIKQALQVPCPLRRELAVR